jgi:hypothetical protein
VGGMFVFGNKATASPDLHTLTRFRHLVTRPVSWSSLTDACH